MSHLIELLLNFSQNFGYSGIVFLMTIESSFVPFPSELIIPPAAYLASQGILNISLVIIAGIAGSLIGAMFNYFLAFYLGRKIVYQIIDCKIFKILLLNAKKIEQAEKYFLKYGGISTFFGRLVPVIRQLISLPAGFSKMNFAKFILYTGIGSGIWVVILAFLGYFFGANQELLAQYYREISYGFIGLVLVVILGIVLKKKNKN